MVTNNCNKIYEKLKQALKEEVQKNRLSGESVSVRFKALTAEEAIGNPKDRDYPIIKGREKIVEADFRGAKGQAFTDEYGDADYLVSDLLRMDLDSNKKRAHFIAAQNAIFSYLGLCDKTVHCKDAQPEECADALLKELGPGKKILLVGLQPRFLERLVRQNKVRVVDLDRENIGTKKFGVLIEDAERTDDAIGWCDYVLVTGSTVVNCTMDKFMKIDKPVVFYGVTISAPAKVLGLKRYCEKGN